MKTTPYPKAHTPGPWAFHPADRIIFDVPVKFGVATVLQQPGEPADADRETAANGHLIAAAPTLYDALLIAENTIRTVLLYETPGSAEYQQYDWVLSALHDAIALAEGRAQ